MVSALVYRLSGPGLNGASHARLFRKLPNWWTAVIRNRCLSLSGRVSNILLYTRLYSCLILLF